MNPDPNPNAAPQPPAYPTTTPAPAPGKGVASTLKIAVPVVALVAIVFGITFILMYTPRDPGPDPNPLSKGGPTAAEPPLRFFTSLREWDPPLLHDERAAEGRKDDYQHLPLLAPSAIKGPPDREAGQVFNYTLQDRLFQGIYEPSGDVKRTTQFWFENGNPKGVTLRLEGLSCSACTSGRVAVIPPEVTRELLQYTAVGALPTGPFSGFKLGMVQPAASLSQLSWDEKGFENFPREQVAFKVQAAANADGWSPQWGILELQFKATADRSKDPLAADFKAQVDGSPEFTTFKFGIRYNVSVPSGLLPPSIEAGKIDLGSADREFEFLIVSATRGPGSEFGDLEVPSYKVEPSPSGDSTPFLEILDKKTVRIPEEELPELQTKWRTRIRTAYKFTLVLHPKVGERRIDIGKFERTVSVTAGGATGQMKVTAMVRGSVWLAADRTEIELPPFPGGRGLKQQPYDLIAEKPGLEVALLKEECKPPKFTYELVKQPDRGGQGHYRLLVTVPEGSFGAVKGEVVLEVKGPNPQRMRIPVRGSGRFGGG